MKNKQLSLSSIPSLIYALIVGIFLLYAFLFVDHNQSPDNALLFWSDGWTSAEGQTVNVDKLYAKATEGNIVITKTLPDSISGITALCFMTHNSNFSIFIDDEYVYGYQAAENITGYGYADIRHSVLLSEEEAGKEIRIEFSSVFRVKGQGNIEKLYIGNPDDYEKLLLKDRILPTILSLVIIFFGILMIGIYFFVPKKANLPYNVLALGFSALLMGFWCFSGTGILQLITGYSIVFRVCNYFLVLFASYPIFCFVNSVTIRKDKLFSRIMFYVWILTFVVIMALRYGVGLDMHNFILLFYLEYAFTIVYMIVLLVRDRRFRAANGVKQDRHLFVIASLCFLIGASFDMISYFIIGNFHFSQGNFVRLGLCCFIFMMIIHFLYWWVGEQRNMKRTDFINNILHYAVANNDPEININEMLSFLVKELNVDRAFIFEKNQDGSFTNTYECCAGQVRSKSSDFSEIPLKGFIDKVFEDIEETGQAIIEDVEDLKDSKNKELYKILHDNGITNTVSGALEANGEYFGMCGVENIHTKSSSLADISEIIRLLSYFFGQLIAQRNNNNKLIQFGYNDLLTGTGNRRAFEKFKNTILDKNSTYGYIMCDINGLKRINDSQGHESGDEMLKYVSRCFMEIFGADHVFRMGGDEFAIFSFVDSESALIEQINTAKEMITAQNYTASIGHVFCENGKTPFDEMRIQADQLMYQEKELFYQGSNERRLKY